MGNTWVWALSLRGRDAMIGHSMWLALNLWAVLGLCAWSNGHTNRQSWLRA